VLLRYLGSVRAGSRTFGIARHQATATRLTQRLLLSSSLPSPPVLRFVIGRITSKEIALFLRGGDRGSDGEEDESKEGDEDAEEEEEEYASFEVSTTASSVAGSVLSLSKRAVVLVAKLAVSSIKVTSRVILAAFEGDEGRESAADEDEVSSGVASKMFRVIRRMWKAAWSPSSSSSSSVKKRKMANDGGIDMDKDSEEADEESDFDADALASTKKRPDFGTFLTKSYGVEATRYDLGDDSAVQPILGGSISDALREARSRARLLVVLIPSSKPGKKKRGGGDKHASDEEAVKGFLSAEVATMAERKARTKGETGSYMLWGAKAGSAEAVAALKRLKATQTNSKGKKRPVLLVAYPAQVIGGGGVPKIVPRVLAQHHCSPPPSSEMMAAWLNALRKRHAKQFAIMQLELREAQLHRERKEGYKDSVQSDRERERREREEEEQRKEIEKAERERREAIEQRREDLRASLPNEPTGAAAVNAKTIALRFADGRSAQRTFAPDTKIATLFDWVDAMFEMERETIQLTTLNGKQSFAWEDSDATLSGAKFGKMTGLRVTKKKVTASDISQQ